MTGEARRDFCSAGEVALGKVEVRSASIFVASSWWTRGKGFVVWSGADRSLPEGARSGERRMLYAEGRSPLADK